MDYERRQIYRGPEKFVDLPSNPKELDDAVDDALSDHPDNGDVMSAVVLKASAKEVTAVRGNGEVLTISGEGLGPCSPVSPTRPRQRPDPPRRGHPGGQDAQERLEITQLPEVEGAFVAMDPRDGAVKALIGGFDFDKNKFNHVTQAWRQPGSSFKPFIYSAALEKASRRPRWSMTHRCSSTRAPPAASRGNRRTTTAPSKARCRCAAR